MPEIENLVYYYYVYRVSTVSLSWINYCLVFRHTLDIRLGWKFINLVTILELLIAPLHQEPGKKSGKAGQVWFNQTYQAFVKKTSLVKSLVRLVLPGF